MPRWPCRRRHRAVTQPMTSGLKRLMSRPSPLAAPLPFICRQQALYSAAHCRCHAEPPSSSWPTSDDAHPYPHPPGLVLARRLAALCSFPPIATALVTGHTWCQTRARRLLRQPTISPVSAAAPSPSPSPNPSPDAYRVLLSNVPHDCCRQPSQLCEHQPAGMGA